MAETSLSRVGRYEIRRELGRGTMGIVYLATDPALDRQIALKTIDLAFAVPAPERPAFEQRFLAEGRVAGRLSHPGIVVVHDVGRDPETGVLYIALEYLEGRTLAERVGEPLGWREVMRVVARLARALHHAHAHGIVHRDVKPANIMLLSSGEPKIMDFGIAKAPHVELTSAGQLFGTPLYMSPEQALGQPVDGRSDLFSLGSIAYLLLTGEPAFRADNVLQVLARVTQDVPTPPTRLDPSLPPAVDAFVARAMAKAPADRYQDGEEMARDAEAVLEGRELEAPELQLEAEEENPLSSLVAEPEAPHLHETLALPPARSPLWPAARRAMAAVALGVVTLALLFLLRPRPASGPATEPAAPGEPASAASAAPSPEPATPPGTKPRPTAIATAEPSAGVGRLAIDFEHHLRNGTLRVWVDDDLVLEEELDARVTKKILSFPVRRGLVAQTLEVAPGKHVVRVQVRWGDNIKTERAWATWKAGASRRLEIRVSRLLGGLSLRWK